jgi:hypothetical protein
MGRRRRCSVLAWYAAHFHMGAEPNTAGLRAVSSWLRSPARSALFPADPRPLEQTATVKLARRYEKLRCAGANVRGECVCCRTRRQRLTEKLATTAPCIPPACPDVFSQRRLDSHTLMCCSCVANLLPNPQATFRFKAVVMNLIMHGQVGNPCACARPPTHTHSFISTYGFQPRSQAQDVPCNTDMTNSDQGDFSMYAQHSRAYTPAHGGPG